MAELEHAYTNIFNNNKNKFRDIAHFFTQRKITESIDDVNTSTLEITKKDIETTNNYLALVFPRNQNTPSLNIEIYGNNGYCFKGKIESYTDNTPHLLVPLNDDKELFIHVYDEKGESNESYISFVHVPKRYQNIEDLPLMQNLNIKKVSELKVNL